MLNGGIGIKTHKSIKHNAVSYLGAKGCLILW